MFLAITNYNINPTFTKCKIQASLSITILCLLRIVANTLAPKLKKSDKNAIIRHFKVLRSYYGRNIKNAPYYMDVEEIPD